MFNNAVIFTFPDGDKFDLQALEEGIGECELKPIEGLALSVRGFVSPMGSAGESLLHHHNGGIWLTIGGEDRILPPSVVNRALQKKVKELEEKEGRAPGAKTRKRIKDEIVTDLIPKAFTKPFRVDVYINTRLGICAVDTSSRKVAEEAVGLVRKALGSFPAIPLATESDASSRMTTLFQGEEVEGLALGGELELKDPASRATIRAANENLSDEDLQRHLATKRVSKLGLTWLDRITFVIGDDLVLRKIKMVGASEDISEAEIDSVQMELETRFALFHGDFSAFYCRLATVFRFHSAMPLFDAKTDEAILAAGEKLRLEIVPSLRNKTPAANDGAGTGSMFSGPGTQQRAAGGGTPTVRVRLE